jgi:hypothetical protein
MAVIIGVDPHKALHTAVAVNNEELELARKRVRSGCAQAEQLVEWVGHGDTLIPEPARHLSPIMELVVGVSTRIDPDTLGHRSRFCTRRGSLKRVNPPQVTYGIYAAAELLASKIGTRPRM